MRLAQMAAALQLIQSQVAAQKGHNLRNAGKGCSASSGRAEM
jgi:hypothetical protein